jgi:DNA-binding transcriptional LysR family regulator
MDGMDRLGALNVFVQAAESRSFTAAGRLLGVSPSAVGKAIARLEERLGVSLFHRSTRSITLTTEGALFLDRCRRIFGEIEAAEQELAQSIDAPKGRLRVSLPLVGMLLMPAINEFIESFPQIELDLDFTDRMVDVIEEGFDVVIRTGEVSDSALMMKVVGSFSHVVVGSPDYFARRGRPEVPQDLLRHACLHHRFPSTGKLERWPLSVDGEDLTLELPSKAVASTLEPLISMAERGLGLACVPRFAVRRPLSEGRLQTVLDENFHNAGVFRVLWPSSRHKAPKIKTFVDFLAKRLFADA